MNEPPAAKHKPLTFSHFWDFIASQIGDSRLTINPSAKNIEQFMQVDCDPKNCLRSASIDSYKRCQCTHLRSPIDLNIVLDVLGETAYNLRGQSRDDLFDIELLEEVAWHIADRYSHLIKIEDQNNKLSNRSRVISFPDYRIRKANTRL